MGGMAIVYLMELLIYPMTGFSLSSVLAFNRSAVLHGQIWRLITFIFIPPDSSILFILFSLYFYWLIGNALENQWGAFRFNIYYLCGMLCTCLLYTSFLVLLVTMRSISLPVVLVLCIEKMCIRDRYITMKYWNFRNPTMTAI